MVHPAVWSSLVLLAKEHFLSVAAVREVISSASEVDGWSLDISYPILFIHLMKNGLTNGRGLREDTYMWLLDQFSILPALLVPREGLSEAVVWGRLGWVVCYIGGTTRPVIAGEKKNIQNR